jgi:hypothetical protein
MTSFARFSNTWISESIMDGWPRVRGLVLRVPHLSRRATGGAFEFRFTPASHLHRSKIRVPPKGCVERSVKERFQDAPLATLRFFGWFADIVFVGQHALMEDAGNQDTGWLLAIKYDVFATLQPAQARANVVARPA